MNQNQYEEREILQIVAQLTEKITKQELLKIINKKNMPLELLKIQEISNLEAIVKYLRENEKLSYREIAQLLKRNPKTLAISYMKAKQKMPQQITIKETQTIPYTAFTEELSILEAITKYLHEEGYKQKKIAEMIGKDPRTIWTTIKRAKQKNQNINNKTTS